MKRNRRSAFTLVEVLTGIVVLGVISTCSWLAVSTLFRGEQLTRNRTIAINLLQKSQEEIRNASLTFYSTLERCQFPGPFFIPNTNSSCGLQVLNANFNGYTRSVAITPQNNSTEIKQAIITVNWTDQGNPVSMNSAVLLARPPDPLPGNIYGTVRSSDQGNALIKGAIITAIPIAGGPTNAANSQSTLGAKNENYDFNSSTGAFMLPVGLWQLTAQAPGFFEYPAKGGAPVNNTVLVTSNAESVFNFTMDPRPDDAILRVRLKDATTGNQLTDFLNGAYFIFDNSQTIQAESNSVGRDHIITFNDMNPKDFTINTYWAYRSGYVGQPSCSGYPFHVDGWSSAQIDASSALSCGNPYNGSQTSDRITVNPNNIRPVDIPLVPVPTATIRGKVIDSAGNPVAGAKVFATWPAVRGVVARWYQNGTYPIATADSNGNYSYVVPAVQEMFSNTVAGALKIQALGRVPFNGCCNTTQTIEMPSNTALVNNLFTGATITAPDLQIINAGSVTCGNVKGIIKNDLTGLGINNVAINIHSVGASTDSSGDYIYQCPSVGFKVPAGPSRFYAAQSQFYTYDSNGNSWYSPQPGVNVQSNQMIDYDAKLWPIGNGTIIVNVIDARTGGPINGAVVKLKTYTNLEVTLVTPSDGKQTFNNTLETWPPVGLPSDNYYKWQNHYEHTLTVKHPSGNYSDYIGAIPRLLKNETLIIDVKLIPTGSGGA